MRSRTRIVEIARALKEIYVFLSDAAAADSIAVQEAFIKNRFSMIMSSSDPEIPPDAFDPLIDHIAGKLARLGNASGSRQATS